jgi:hypothetical protein
MRQWIYLVELLFAIIPHGIFSWYWLQTMCYTLAHAPCLLLRFVRTIFRTVADHKLCHQSLLHFGSVASVATPQHTCLHTWPLLGPDPTLICFRFLIHCPGFVLVLSCSSQQLLFLLNNLWSGLFLSSDWWYSHALWSSLCVRSSVDLHGSCSIWSGLCLCSMMNRLVQVILKAYVVFIATQFD